MASIELAEGTNSDFERILAHLETHEVEGALDRIDEIIAAIDVLAQSPHIGRPVSDGQRELVIGRRSHGYVARYSYDSVKDVVRILAIRHQREGGITQR